MCDTNPGIKTLRTVLHVVLMLGVSVVISGCGGGGGGDSGSTATDTAAPTATSSSITTNEDTPAQGTLIVNDPNNGALKYSIVSNGTKGAATITNASTGSFVYTPNPDTTGTDTFTFKASNVSSDSNTATITVTIIAVNDRPVSTPGGFTTNEDTPVSGMLVATDADLQPLTYRIVNNGSKGSAMITNPSTGAFVYTPDTNTNGIDSFSFLANDGLLDSNPSTVTITINPVNDAPVAQGTCSTTYQAQVLKGTLSATDRETPHLLTYSLNADGSGGAGPIMTSKGAMVTITDPTTGAFTYQPGTEAGDRRGRDSFAYQVSDPDGAVSRATQTVIVNETIMPLGDSITMGTIDGPVPPADSRVGYRKPLYDALVATGFTFDLVGTGTDGYGVSNFDYDHEGHGGWTAAEIAWGRSGGYPIDGVRAWLDANPADIILLHIGTNQLTPNTDVDVASILDEIDLWETGASGNHVTVVLARIIDQDPINPDVALYNSHLVALAKNRIANGDDIVVVNQHDALTYPDDMGSQLHPNKNGYAKMSNVWFTALENLVDKCP